MYGIRIENKHLNVETSSNGINSNAKNVLDDDLNTYWAEGVVGFGRKEWIKITYVLPVDTSLVNIIIFPGHGGDEKTFKEYNHLKTVILKYYNSYWYGYGDLEGEEGGTEYSIIRLLFNDINKYHVFTIAPGMQGGKGKKIEITLYIESVYSGSKYDETCIPEIILLKDEVM